MVNGTLRVFFVLCTAAMAAHPVQAQQQQQYPSRPIEIVVPFGAGSTGDILARLVGASYTKELGQPVVVQNQPGAGGTIGSAAVARAKYDGHTLVLGTIASHGIGALMFPSATYDAAKDFEPITLIANAPNMLVVHRSIPVSTAASSSNTRRKSAE